MPTPKAIVVIRKILGMKISEGADLYEQSESIYKDSGVIKKEVCHKLPRCDNGHIIKNEKEILGYCQRCGNVLCTAKSCGATCQCGRLECTKHMFFESDGSALCWRCELKSVMKKLIIGK